MGLIIDENLGAAGTHVFVIGVSAYKHFEDGGEPTAKGELIGMRQLTAAARSASEFAAWMLNEYKNEEAPLSSLRVLLSESPGEIIHDDIQDLLNGDRSATVDNVEADLIGFQSACEHNKDNVGVVYVAGHGVQLTKTGSILLLHDCGSNGHANLLKGAIDMAGVHAGLNHTTAAQAQFWFVDACRQKLAIRRQFENLAGALTLDEKPGIVESNPMFLAATTGTQAFARINGTTLFCEALLWGLDGHMGSAPRDKICDHWHVSAHTLLDELGPKVKSLADAEGVEQSVDPTGRLVNALFHKYAEVPKVDLKVDLLPEDAIAGSRGSLRHDDHGMVVEDSDVWPMEAHVEAGLYEIKIDTPADFTDIQKLLSLNPPSENVEVDASP